MDTSSVLSINLPSLHISAGMCLHCNKVRSRKYSLSSSSGRRSASNNSCINSSAASSSTRRPSSNLSRLNSAISRVIIEINRMVGITQSLKEFGGRSRQFFQGGHSFSFQRTSPLIKLPDHLVIRVYDPNIISTRRYFKD